MSAPSSPISQKKTLTITEMAAQTIVQMTGTTTNGRKVQQLQISQSSFSSSSTNDSPPPSPVSPQLFIERQQQQRNLLESPKKDVKQVQVEAENEKFRATIKSLGQENKKLKSEVHKLAQGRILDKGKDTTSQSQPVEQVQHQVEQVQQQQSQEIQTQTEQINTQTIQTQTDHLSHEEVLEKQLEKLKLENSEEQIKHQQQIARLELEKAEKEKIRIAEKVNLHIENMVKGIEGGQILITAPFLLAAAIAPAFGPLPAVLIISSSIVSTNLIDNERIKKSIIMRDQLKKYLIEHFEEFESDPETTIETAWKFLSTSSK
jgi:hypothetical protein